VVKTPVRVPVTRLKAPVPSVNVNVPANLLTCPSASAGVGSLMTWA
jgi:hypothetical protein